MHTNSAGNNLRSILPSHSILTAHHIMTTTQQTNSELHKEFAAYIERDAVYNKRTHKGQRNAQRRAKQAQRNRYMDSY